MTSKTAVDTFRALLATLFLPHLFTLSTICTGNRKIYYKMAITDHLGIEDVFQKFVSLFFTSTERFHTIFGFI